MQKGEVEEGLCWCLQVDTHTRWRISALKLANAALWMLFLVINSSFSRATVSSLRFTRPSKLNSRACSHTHTHKTIEQRCKDFVSKMAFLSFGFDSGKYVVNSMILKMSTSFQLDVNST